MIQPCKNMNKWFGILTSITAESETICNALIIPQIRPMPPLKTKAMKKFPDYITCIKLPATSVFSTIFDANSLSAIYAGRPPASSGTPLSNESLFIDSKVSALLNNDTSFIIIPMFAAPPMLIYAGSAKVIFIVSFSGPWDMTAGIKDILSASPSIYPS